MMGPPETECRECGEFVSTVFDHADGCSVASRIAQRHIERLEDNAGTVWETENGKEQLDRLREEFHEE